MYAEKYIKFHTLHAHTHTYNKWKLSTNASNFNLIKYPSSLENGNIFVYSPGFFCKSFVALNNPMQFKMIKIPEKCIWIRKFRSIALKNHFSNANIAKCFSCFYILLHFLLRQQCTRMCSMFCNVTFNTLLQSRVVG